MKWRGKKKISEHNWSHIHQKIWVIQQWQCVYTTVGIGFIQISKHFRLLTFTVSKCICIKRGRFTGSISVTWHQQTHMGTFGKNSENETDNDNSRVDRRAGRYGIYFLFLTIITRDVFDGYLYQDICSLMQNISVPHVK